MSTPQQQQKEPTFWREVGKSVLTSVIVGVIVGMLSAYLTVQKVAQLADQNTARITKLEDRQDADDQARGDTSERLIRLETKIDLLLDGKLKDR